MANDLRQLHELARLYGVQTSYTDVHGGRRKASGETLLRVLGALGAPLESPARAEEAVSLRLKETWETMADPVRVAWEGELHHLDVRLPEHRAQASFRLVLEDENGDKTERSGDLSDFPTVANVNVDGLSYVAKRLSGFERLPAGYHRLHVESDGAATESLVIASPKRAYSPAQPAAGPGGWGVLAPVYAVHSRRSLGAGDLADFEALWQWTAELGASFVATLPIQATYLADPFDPSPYSPVSRLFWNEFYIALDRVPELSTCIAARELVASAPFQQEIAAWRQAPEIDYRRQAAGRRQVLEMLADRCFQQEGPRWNSLRQYVASHPAVEDYARFRAVGERLSSVWPQWPERLRQGRIEPGDYDEKSFRYHLYAQWILHEQLSGAAQRLRQGGPGLYLDLPLGVHRHGYDVWRNPALFATELSGGAPPDAVFTKGQDWDFAPLRPDRLRADRYRYVIEGLRCLLRHAGILRIDHVMGLHRLYCIPAGMPAAGGAYLRYPAEELYAILCIESHRSGSVIVGENLGTVPSYVNSAMRRHAIRRTYVVQYELKPDREQPLKPPERQVVASLNTHDMPPFAAYWQGAELDDLQALGLFDDGAIEVERERRGTIREGLADLLRRAGHLRGEPASLDGPHEALTQWLAASSAEYVVLNLEDLWLETLPQNTPGTTTERPNWRRKLRHSLETLCEDSQFRELLDTVSRLRRARRDSPGSVPRPLSVRGGVPSTAKGEESI